MIDLRLAGSRRPINTTCPVIRLTVQVKFIGEKCKIGHRREPHACGTEIEQASRLCLTRLFLQICYGNCRATAPTVCDGKVPSPTGSCQTAKAKTVLA